MPSKRWHKVLGHYFFHHFGGWLGRTLNRATSNIVDVIQAILSLAIGWVDVTRCDKENLTEVRGLYRFN
ncbi:MAG: hypothetical protein II670_01985, partial [Alphaproteobacteria bacterium]|nr:hypothetical protein [Alphaproteobacteria bacterium]